jgi:hypothetical protein
VRNLLLDNPFGRTFVIINDMEDGLIEHYSLSVNQMTNADSNSLLSKPSVSDMNSARGVVSAAINFSKSD